MTYRNGEIKERKLAQEKGSSAFSSHCRIPVSAGKRDTFSVCSVLILLVAAIAFHVLFFLLFRPIINERSIKRPGKGFTLLLTPEKVQMAVKEYGLEYFLAYSDPVKAMEIEKKFSFGAWENYSHVPPFSREMLHKYSGSLSFSSKKSSEDISLSPSRTLAELSSFSSAVIPISSSRDKRMQAMEKKDLSTEKEAPDLITEKDFPVWQFSSGKVRKGFLMSAEKGATVLEKYKDQVSSFTRYRITTPGKGLPPELILMHSCGIKALDHLARHELYTFLGDPFRYNKQVSRSVFYCTVIWSETLLTLRENRNTAEIPADKNIKGGEKK
ncbi:MAG: hypothetical protein IKA79_07560 [Lentisphaeria bacterium]|nr:hypothetical protein [Lentisphaeria bacterium]